MNYPHNEYVIARSDAKGNEYLISIKSQHDERSWIIAMSADPLVQFITHHKYLSERECETHTMYATPERLKLTMTCPIKLYDGNPTS